MEEQQRVLAYALAKQIDNEELGSITGGRGAGGLMCSSETLKASGITMRTLDAGIDVHVDW